MILTKLVSEGYTAHTQHVGVSKSVCSLFVVTDIVLLQDLEIVFL